MYKAPLFIKLNLSAGISVFLYCNELSKPSIYLRCWTLLLLGEVPHNVI